ncbi:hypothetical protein [Bosea sp. PAMC 26642]|uniref:hypothetical protein n=1 Tax=Bosea sp. (strain PAMC 26642) TaxID=1792307 RepID=UPI0007701F9A|nr:hypothetical protein [Bosea sp. PAMC 26642]AMJ60958.1 hypothetical protein AXW83_12210 [Bosea sp. PAMC 26642]
MAHPKIIDGGAKVASEGSHDERKIAMAAVNAYGIEAIKATFLLNGGAIIALLALLSALYAKDSAYVAGAARLLTKSLIPAFKFFIGGVVSAAMIAGIGYLNWSILAQAYWQPADWHNFVERAEWATIPRWYNPLIETTRAIAIVCFFLSLFCFCRGAWIVAKAFLKVHL